MRKKEESFLSKVFNWTFTLVLAWVISVQMCGASNPTLRFAQVSDAHFSTFEEDTSYKILKSSGLVLDDVVSQINTTPNVDFVMFTGDLINKPKESELMAFIPHANMLNTPWYAVFGNHDTQIDVSLTKTLYFDILNGHNPNFCYKQSYYSFCPKKNFKVLALDTTVVHRDTMQGEISEEQLHWIKEEMDNSKGDVVVIFTHVPVVEPFPNESHRLVNSYDLKLLLKKYDNPIIICSGHYHATKIIQEDNILYINSPSLVTFPNAFRIISVCPQRNKVIVDVYLKETRLKELQDKAKAKVMGSALLYGKESDRTATYELPKKRDRNSF